MSVPPEQITLLHLSDPQFGRNHRFGGGEPADTLLQRLKADLDGLRKTEGLAPDLLVLTGDLAEWGTRDEFDEVLAFIDGLAQHLKLPPRRIACVPGNHDINRKLCESHFLGQQGRGGSPVPPYWPKWEPYKERLFDPLYAGEPSITFTEDAPWTLFEVPDLRLVVAGVNSTLKESHQDGDHYGWVDEAQLQWFAKRLEDFKARRWLRIGAVHHNVRRGQTDDNENLRDADDFERYLVDTDLVNLVLHGHTHQGRLHWWTPTVPILATGSAALTTDPRPPEVPNQYQIIRIEPGRLRQWCRAYAPERKQFIADPRATKDGNDWRREEPIHWVDVVWIDAAAGPGSRPDDGPTAASPAVPGPDPAPIKPARPKPRRGRGKGRSDDLGAPTLAAHVGNASADLAASASSEPPVRSGPAVTAKPQRIPGPKPEHMGDIETFDCLLSHNHKDNRAVHALAEALRAVGVSVWLDEEQLRPGLPWQPQLEAGIRASHSVAVLIRSSRGCLELTV